MHHDHQHAQQNLPQGAPNFFGLGIAPRILDRLQEMKFVTPTPIQFKSIPIGIEGKDVIGIAQTGTGKTVAFGIPMIQRLAQVQGRGLVLVPTRELALQVDSVLHKIGGPLGIKTAVLIGGASMNEQISQLRKHPRILIATPGRLIDHLNQGTAKIHDVEILVIDEADRMFDMGFAPQVEFIIRAVAKERQTLLFSATMPPDIVRLMTRHMKLPVQVEIAPAGTAAERVTQEVYVVKPEMKKKLLAVILDKYRGTVLLFTRTKIGARKVARDIREMGHKASEIHSDRSLSQRKQALEGFKNGQHRVLVATDIAARGIDVKGIELVINYDLPEDADNYVHRIGRTGRAGLPGHAISFAFPDQGTEVRRIEQLTRTSIPIAEHPELPAEKFHTAPSVSRTVFSSHKRGRFGRGRRRR